MVNVNYGCKIKCKSLFDQIQDVFALIDSEEEPKKVLVVSHSRILIHLLDHVQSCPKYLIKGWRPEYYQVLTNCGYFKVKVEKKSRQENNFKIEDDLERKRTLEFEAPSRPESFPPSSFFHYAKTTESMKRFQNCVQQ